MKWTEKVKQIPEKNEVQRPEQWLYEETVTKWAALAVSIRLTADVATASLHCRCHTLSGQCAQAPVTVVLTLHKEMKLATV